MKKLFILAVICLMAASCGSFDSDLRWIPISTDSSDDESITFVDIKTGKKCGKTYEAAYRFVDGVALVREDEGWTYINTKFEKLFNTYFVSATHFCEDIAFAVKEDEIIKAIDKKGKVLFNVDFAEEIYAYNHGYAVFKNAEDKVGMIDTKGNIVLEAKYDFLNVVAKNLIIVKEDSDDDEFGVIDAKGKEIIPIEYESIRYVDDYFTVGKSSKNGPTKYGIFNNKGKQIIDFEYKFICKDGKYFAFETKKGRYGWINKKGEYVIDPEYESTRGFGKGKYAAVRDKDDEWGFINMKGEWVIDAKYENTSGLLENGQAIIENDDDEYGVIDIEDNKLIKVNKRNIRYLTSDYYLVENMDGELGVMRANGEEEWTVKPSYERSSNAKLELSYSAESDYVNLDVIGNALKTTFSSLERTRLDDLCTRYDISHSDFSKYYSDDVHLFKNYHKNFSISCRTPEIRAWEEYYTYTYYYYRDTNYRFKGWMTISEYKIALELSGKYRNKLSKIEEYVLNSPSLNNSQNGYSIYGYSNGYDTVYITLSISDGYNSINEAVEAAETAQ